MHSTYDTPSGVEIRDLWKTSSAFSAPQICHAFDSIPTQPGTKPSQFEDPMNRSPRPTRYLARAAAVIGLAMVLAAPARGEEPKGLWKLVVLAYGDDNFAIIDLHRQDGALRGVMVDANKGLLENGKVEKASFEDARLTLDLKGERGILIEFAGTEAKTGLYAGQYVGTVRLFDERYPARLEKTREERMPAPRPNPLVQDFLKAAREPDAKSKANKLVALAKKNPGVPANHLIYTELLATAEAAGLTPAEVDAHFATWKAEAETFGAPWVQEIGLKALKAIAPSKPMAESAVKLGQDLERSVSGDGSTETKATVAGLLATAAKNAGKADLAAESESRAAKFETMLDEEYNKKVPPFAVQRYAGRKKPGEAQPVVFELFTGAQCGPCASVDVAFDALLKTFGPTELIGLQYHLHIPGPDPLSSPASEARREYYADNFRGTPSSFLNGRPDGEGGGPMSMAENRYAGFRSLVEKLLEQDKKTTVTVSAKQAGDVVSIIASATTPPPKSGSKNSSMKLRLALTEESIRYVGSNKIRFHHHVVRAFPGGMNGTDIVDGKATVELKVELARLREELAKYLTESTSQPFAGTIPGIELKDLSVVAFVQDDLDKAILGVVTVPVTPSNP